MVGGRSVIMIKIKPPKNNMEISMKRSLLMCNLPCILNSNALALLLYPHIGRTYKTVLRDISRSPESLPEPEDFKGRSKKRWNTEATLEWCPPRIRAAIIQECSDKKWRNPKKVDLPPPLRSIAEELELANSEIIGNVCVRQGREASKSRSKKS
jgi:hypothetical protein